MSMEFDRDFDGYLNADHGAAGEKVLIHQQAVLHPLSM